MVGPDNHCSATTSRTPGFCVKHIMCVVSGCSLLVPWHDAASKNSSEFSYARTELEFVYSGEMLAQTRRFLSRISIYRRASRKIDGSTVAMDQIAVLAAGSIDILDDSLLGVPLLVLAGAWWTAELAKSRKLWVYCSRNKARCLPYADQLDRHRLGCNSRLRRPTLFLALQVVHRSSRAEEMPCIGFKTFRVDRP